MDIPFTYHQIDSCNGKVYDPSTGPAAGGDPTMGMTFDAYLDYAFPGQRARGYIRHDVSTLTVKP